MKFWVLLFLAVLSFNTRAQQILNVRDQAKLVDELLADRINNLLPQLMERNGIDMWILISREYNEDPVLKTFLPATWLSARRRTILVFYNNPAKKQYEKLAIARYNVGSTIQSAWNVQQFPDQWDALMDIINTRQPKKIGINLSKDFGHADGLVVTDHAAFLSKLPAAYKNNIVSAETLAVNWLETRSAREMQIYPQLVAITHQIIDEGFSEKVITPGVTTTDDVVWWFRQKMNDLGLSTWFHPSVAVQRNDTENFEHQRSFSNRPKDDVIIPGDLLHVDIGITYLRLNTDIQQHAYILKPGETQLPAFLKIAFEKSNRLQDILTSQFAVGKTGNQILAAALAQAKQENIEASIYTHPLGFHGHAAGPTIGLWDQQGGVPGSGDFKMNYKTAYSIELNTATLITEWNKSIRIMLEEDGYFDESGFRYINGRQKEIYIIPRQNTAIGR
ncbi:MAG: M24 family metallopeptidase [Flavihumibacter sp.]|nr:M24 family metallopeptidase [Flavihumibacter sp.]